MITRDSLFPTHKSTRKSTQTATAQADFLFFTRSINSASAWLGDILAKNPILGKTLAKHPPPPWEDAKARSALNAKSVHYKLLWTKAQRFQKLAELNAQHELNYQ